MNKKGLLIVYSGCSGVGKGTIMRELLERNDTFRLSVSATTRSPRPGETHGKEYYFMTDDEFNSMIEKKEFLEYNTYSQHRYGTLAKAVDEMLDQGLNVFLEIEVKGGLQVMKLRPDCMSIFIVPPSMEELEKRLRGRGTESEEEIAIRMATAREEMKLKDRYDFIVENDDLEDAINEVISIVKREQDKRN